MTDPDVERMIRLVEVAKLAQDGVITTSEAIARVRRDADLVAGADVPRMAAGGWEVARERRNPGCLVTGLLHEWTVTHAADDPIAVFASGEAFVRAATEVLIARDDGDLYRRAHRAADRMIEAAEPAWVPVAHYRAGQLHLAPYALDPVNNQSDYPLGRQQRVLREQWLWPTTPLKEQLMPAPAGELGRAVRHLVAVADGTTGRNRGAALAHLAFAEYSRHLADGSGSLSDVDRWCDESATLLPPQAGEPLAQGRLMLLYALRGKSGPFVERGISVPPFDTKPNGSVYNVLVGITIVRLLAGLFRANEAGEIVAAVWPLVSDDPDLQAQRLFLDCAAVHSLPGDSVGCRARVLGAKLASSRERGLTGAALAADRMHALLCGFDVEAPEAEEAAAIAAVRNHAPQLDRQLGVVLADRKWMAARRALTRQVSESVPALIDAVNTLAHTGNRDLAMFALQTLAGVLRGTSADVFPNIVKDRGLLEELVRMTDNVLIGPPEAGGRVVVHCLSKLLAGWTQLLRIEPHWDVVAVEYILATMQLLKGRALAGALTQPGPAPSDSEIVRALMLIAELDADPGDAPDDRPLRETTIGTDTEAVLNSYLQGAERERGSTLAQRRANVRRRAQAADTARLLASAGVAPRHPLTDYARALPDDAVLLNICVGGVGANASEGLQAVLVGRGVLRVVWLSDPDKTTRVHVELGLHREFGVSTTVFSELGIGIARLRRALVEDPLHRDVTRAAERELAMRAKYLSDGVLKPLAEFAVTHDRPRLIFWPHESLYFLPLPLVPFRDGILADYFTVTILPSVECLFWEPVATTANPAVRTIACAAGGLSVGLPEEPSLHEQAERIAGLFGTRPLTGDNASPAAALEALSTSRYLHLAAHGTQDVDAPLFARLYLAGGALHAYEILEQDLRGTELVTLSACESALLRYDFLDNLHGLAPAFLRAGARAVIGALWPVDPEVAATFFTELYAYLAGGGTRVDAFRYAQNQARASHPNYRDWGGFTYFGA